MKKKHLAASHGPPRTGPAYWECCRLCTISYSGEKLIFKHNFERKLFLRLLGIGVFVYRSYWDIDETHNLELQEECYLTPKIVLSNRFLLT